ncbi:MULTISPECIES: DUF1963 domain-containing protein [unclassified Nonomuraea]|uniref:DUF1963 domain-containing protein n=1 Tax=unclassified Nonomuraea TaxID=2593643 RepID=UPI0033CF147F
MDYQESLAKVEALCVEQLGEHLGRQLAALARPGFGLYDHGFEVEDCLPRESRTTFGGPAFLDPGTPWPEHEGLPLSLYAVLDIASMPAWLGDELPADVGLLNFFCLDPNDEYRAATGGRRDTMDDLQVCHVVPADAARAVEVEAPEPATVHDQIPLQAVRAVTLPMSSHWYNYDRILDTLDVGAEAARSPGHIVCERFDWEGFTMDQGLYCKEDDDGDFVSLGLCQAFGWPWLNREATERPYRHLLTLSLLTLDTPEDRWAWDDGGYVHFLIDEEALRAGDFSQVRVELSTGHH